MEESFLHFIWKFQNFNKTDLKTVDGETVDIIKQGFYNSDAGPDFLHSKIFIAGIEWFGHIEIHTKSSEWLKHNHDRNPGYDNVILHVVYEADTDIRRTDGSKIPTLILKDRLDFNLYGNYKNLISSISPVPCNFHLLKVEQQIKLGMLDKVLIQRLETKGNKVLTLLKSNIKDWEETAYQMLALNFGFKINSDAFLLLSKAVPYKIIKKHSDNLLQIEAMLFGASNLLPRESSDPYILLLKREYSFLSHKYELKQKEMTNIQWKFLRLRPANFPTLRIAQFAAVLASANNLFSSLIEVDALEKAIKLLDVSTSKYWESHYNFSKETEARDHSIGEDSIENIIINTVCPLLAAYKLEKDEVKYIDRAINLLENIKAESNKITRFYTSSFARIKNAFDSQALIELHNSYCSQRRCLNCNIGILIIKNQSKFD